MLKRILVSILLFIVVVWVAFSFLSNIWDKMVFLAISLVLVIAYQLSGSMKIAVAVVVFIPIFFFFASISFPFCDSEIVKSGFIGNEKFPLTSCSCVGIKKIISTISSKNSNQCIGVRVKCNKYNAYYFGNTTNYTKKEIPCDTVEEEEKKATSVYFNNKSENITQTFKWERGTLVEASRFGTVDDFLKIKNVESGIEFEALYDGPRCESVSYELKKFMNVFSVVETNQKNCTYQIVNKIVRGSITDINSGSYRLFISVKDPDTRIRDHVVGEDFLVKAED